MADTADGPDLHPVTKELASGPNFAAVTTVFPSGMLQTHMIWAHVLDGQLVLNTEVHRAKYRNIQRDPRVTVLLRDEDNPYRYAEVRGEVTSTTTGPQARESLDEISRKYTGQNYAEDHIKTERVIVWVTPHRQTIVDQRRGIGTED